MNSQQWQSFLMSCLNILRNGQSKYDGFKAISEIITLITLKMIEPRICNMDVRSKKSDNQIRIGEDCKFTNLYNTYCIGEEDDTDLHKKGRELFCLLYNTSRVWDEENVWNDDDSDIVGITKVKNNKSECVVVRFNRYTENLRKLTCNIETYKTVTTFEKNHYRDVQQLVVKIQENFADADMENFEYDAFGEAYERMLADEFGNGSKRNGQYFTRRDLIKLVVKELNIKPTDKCYDPACGTGGFILELLRQHKTNKTYIAENVFGQEYLKEVYKTLSFNLMSNHYDPALKNITYGDSINKDYQVKVFEKFDVVSANPPYGGTIKHAPPFHGITGKNSTAVFLQHIYNSLKVGGRAGVVVDRGIFENGVDSNGWETNFRKFLVENTKITKIIYLPTGIFKHTNYATGVIFFIKGEPTTNIEYIEGYFKPKDKGKGDKPMYLKEGLNIDINAIVAKNYSLKLGDYDGSCDEDDKNSDLWIPLGDVVQFYSTTKHCTSIGQNNGKYRFYSSSQKDKLYLDNYEIDKECVIIGNGGASNIHIDKMFTPSKHVTACHVKTKNFSNIFIYFYLRLNIIMVENGFSGGGLKWLNRAKIKAFKIPKLSLGHQQEIVDFLDKIYETRSIEQTTKYLKNIPIFNLLIMKDYTMFERMMYYQDNIKFLQEEIAGVETKRNDAIKGIIRFETLGCEEKALGDIVTFNIGGTPSRKNGDYFGGDNLWVSVRELNGGKISETKEKITELGIKNSSVKLIKKGSIMTSFKLSIGKTGIADKDMYCNEAIMFFKHENPFTNMYLYYWLTYTNIDKYASGQIGKGSLNKSSLNKIKIPVPSLEKQQEIVNKIEEINAETSHYTKYAELLTTELNSVIETIQRLTIFEAIPESEPEILYDAEGYSYYYDENGERQYCTEQDDEEENQDVEQEEIVKPKKKKKVIPVQDNEEEKQDEKQNEKQDEEQVTVEKDSNGYDILEDDDGYSYYKDEYGCQHYYDDSKKQKLLINKSNKPYREFRMNDNLYHVINEEVFTVKNKKASKICGYYRNGSFESLTL